MTENPEDTNMKNQTYSRRVSDNPNDILLTVRETEEAGGWNFEVVRDGEDVVSRHKTFEDARAALDALIDD